MKRINKYSDTLYNQSLSTTYRCHITAVVSLFFEGIHQPPVSMILDEIRRLRIAKVSRHIVIVFLQSFRLIQFVLKMSESHETLIIDEHRIGLMSGIVIR